MNNMKLDARWMSPFERDDERYWILRPSDHTEDGLFWAGPDAARPVFWLAMEESPAEVRGALVLAEIQRHRAASALRRRKRLRGLDRLAEVLVVGRVRTRNRRNRTT
jgi:hypothetical protein